MSSAWDKFVELRNTAPVIDVKDEYCLPRGEMNPGIFIRMLETMVERNLVLDVWEQFASPESAKKFRKIAMERRAWLESWGMEGHSSGVQGYCVKDSTMEHPDRLTRMCGVLMHPPYFGSSVMSKSSADLSVLKDMEEYKRRLWAAFRTASVALQDGGLVCAVGRRYRYNGDEIQLDRWMVELAEVVGFGVEEVWNSCPDVVILFTWR